MDRLVLPFPLQHGRVMVKGSHSALDPVTELLGAVAERYQAVGLSMPDLTGLTRSQIIQPIHSALLILGPLYLAADFSVLGSGPLYATGLKASTATYCTADVQAARRACVLLEYVPASLDTQIFDFDFAYLPDSESSQAPYAGWATPSYDALGRPVAAWRVASPVSMLHGQFWIGQGPSSTFQWPLLLGLQEQPLTTESGMALSTEEGFIILPEFIGLIQDRPDIRIAHDTGSFDLDLVVKPRFHYFPGPGLIKERHRHVALAPNRAVVGQSVHCSFTSLSLCDYTVRVTSPVVVHPTEMFSALASGTTTFPLTTFNFTVPDLPNGIYFVEVATKEEVVRRFRAALVIIQTA